MLFAPLVALLYIVIYNLEVEWPFRFFLIGYSMILGALIVGIITPFISRSRVVPHALERPQ